MKTAEFDKNCTYLVTGAAGFIGYHLSSRLLTQGAAVVGFDNLNAYYDVSLKEERLRLLQDAGSRADCGRFDFVKGDLADADAVERLFLTYRPDIVVHLAAQAGVRYSIEHPDEYIQSNIVGSFHILEACRRHPVRHLLFASSSSVYGGNTKIPFSTKDPVDEPVSLYAATKKSDELMAHCYSRLYGIPATGLRFFTVYGPYGRPDMAYYRFAQKIVQNEPIQVFNYGDMLRDFTYVDDIVDGVMRMLNRPPKDNGKGARYKIYNIGNNRPERLTDLIRILEELLGREAKKEFLPMQPGDVYQTYADIEDLKRDFAFQPGTELRDGLRHFVEWFQEYHG